LNQLLGGDDLTIIALGKFGGHEINYGADLDILFVGNDERVAQNLMVAMAQPSAEGNISVLDARLRPDGEKGPLVSSLESYANYYRQRAQSWEIHALTRARPITGPLQQVYIDMARSVWRDVGRKPDLFEKIDNMLLRIRHDRSSGTDFLDFKTGEGGLIEAEFFVQALQMRIGIWDPTWRNALNLLRDNGAISADEAEVVLRSYELLRRCETVLRRWEIKNISVLPADPDEQRKLALRLGYESVAGFSKEYADARGAIHALYHRRVKTVAR
jgi:glutamate-ammonia-ligase adenylyltransferase